MLKHQSLKDINDKKTVKLTSMGNVHEIMIMDKVNISGLPVKKISKNEYVLLETGEIKTYEQTCENRSDNKESLRKTFKRLRELITTNFHGNDNELAFTVTYAENMTDTKVLYKDFDKFMKRLKYKYADIDYISVVEPQGRGAWHCHILLRFNGLEKAYIANKEVAEMWGNGFVSVKAIRKDVDNLGAYLSAYLGDIELNDSNITKLVLDGALKLGESINIKEVEVNGKKKKFIKGGRLHFYPVGMNIYRASRGMKKPEKRYMKYINAKKIVGDGTPDYSTRMRLLDDDGNEINSIQYECYNLKRTK